MSNFSPAELFSALAVPQTTEQPPTPGGLAALAPSQAEVGESTAHVLATPDAPSAAAALGGKALTPEQQGALTAVVAGYDGQVGDPLRSRADLARMAHAVNAGLVPPDSEPARLWTKATSNPDALAPADAARLLGHVGALASAAKDVPHPELKLAPGADITAAVPDKQGGFALDVKTNGPAAASMAPTVATAPPVANPPAPDGPVVRVLPGGGTAVFAPPDRGAAVALRHLYPADGNRWIDRQPRAVPSLQRTMLDAGSAESFDNNLMGGPHPATQSGTRVLFEVPPQRQAIFQQWAKATNASPQETGPVIVQEGTDQRTVNKYVVSTADDVKKTANELSDVVGAKKVTVYAPAQPDGMVPVTEHVFSDGTRTVAVRSSEQDIQSPHAYIAYVKPEDAQGLAVHTPPTGWQADQEGSSGILANTAKVTYGHIQDKVTPADSLTDIMIGRSKASHFAIGADNNGVPVVSVGRSAEEAAAGLPMPDVQARASHGVVQVVPSTDQDLAPAYRAVALLNALGVDTSRTKVTVSSGSAQGQDQQLNQ